MKFVSLCYVLSATLLLVLFLGVHSKIGTNMRVSKTGINVSLEELGRMRQSDKVFNPNKITKYYKNQKSEKDFKGEFIDSVFPPNNYSIEGKDQTGNFLDKTAEPEAKTIMGSDPNNYPEWKRAKDIFQGKTYYVFKDKIEPLDVNQNELGNCYFLSSIASVAEFPQLIYQLFRTTTVPTNNYYELVLFIDGEWQVVVLDDFFVVNKGTNTPKFVTPNGEELWVMLLEKAWAKVNEGDANTVGGQNQDAFYGLVGFTSEYISTSDIKINDLFTKIFDADKANDIISGGTKQGSTTEEKLNNGLVLGHAYTLIGAVKLQVDGKEVRLVQMRNPWGKTEWNGDWSDNSSLWTADLRKAAGFTEAKDDGIFFMPIEEYVKFYDVTEICHVKYDAAVKSFRLEGSDMNGPVVFDFTIGEDSFVTIDIFAKHKRFNRKSLPTNLISLVLGTYDGDQKLIHTNSGCSGGAYGEINANLKKGNYVLWAYDSYFRLPESTKPDHYILRIISQTQNVRYQKIGLDSESKLITKLVDSKINFDKSEIESSYAQKYFLLNDSCINSFKFSNLSSDTKFYLNFDLSKNINYINLPPFDFKQKTVVTVPSKSSIVLVAVRENYYGSASYNAQYQSQEEAPKNNLNFPTVESINASDFLLKESSILTKLDYTTIKLIDAQKNLR